MDPILPNGLLPTDSPELACGLSAQQWVEMLNSNKAVKAQKAINYFDDNQEREMESLLDNQSRGRAGWRAEGMFVRTRNITKMIVEKSGRLFKDAPPTLELRIANKEDDKLNELLQAELDKTEWQEDFSNLDQIVRLMKTGILLVQWNTYSNRLEFEVLARHNTEVQIDPVTKQIEGLIYRTVLNDEFARYRLITLDTIYDLHVEGASNQPRIISQEDNPWGIVPAVQWYDTAKPRSGFWQDGGYDLIGMNEMFNLYLTDVEFCMSWMLKPTMISNIPLEGARPGVVSQASFGNLSGNRAGSYSMDPAITGGPGRFVYLDSNGVNSPFVKYEAPVVQLQVIDQLMTGLITAAAQDWSVHLESTSTAVRTSQATSGFALIVKEMDNKELRKQRQNMFREGFKRFYRVLATVANTAYGRDVFPEDAELFVEFTDPKLPVEAKEEMDLWLEKITAGLATPLDFYMETDGLTRAEAMDRFTDVEIFKAQMPLITALATANAQAALTEMLATTQSGVALIGGVAVEDAGNNRTVADIEQGWRERGDALNPTAWGKDRDAS
jgi:hypothetical protein